MAINTTGSIAGHALPTLPSVVVDSYNLDVREGREILNHRLRKAAFYDLIDPIELDQSAVTEKRTSHRISRKDLETALESGGSAASLEVEKAVEIFAGEMAHVIGKFLKTKEWSGVERIVIGGGFRKGKIGKLCIARAGAKLAAEGAKVELVPTRHKPDEAGLIGGAHILPTWMLDGHDAILCADIGGTNIRVGIVALRFSKAADLSKAEVAASDIWHHAEDDPKRTATVATLVRMLRSMQKTAAKRKLALVPVISLGCPGIIDQDGSIVHGAVNLPGGNWESEHFNLAAAVAKEIPVIGSHSTLLLMHNDAVVQGLSQIPWMQDVKRWGVMTIGTGLGNACFTTRQV